MSGRIRKHAPRLRGKRNLTDGRTPKQAEVYWAIGLVDSLGEAFHERLIEVIGENRGRRGSVSARQVLIGWLLAAYDPRAGAGHTHAAKNLLALDEHQRALIGLPNLPAGRAYQRVWDKTTVIIGALNEGFTIGEGALVPRVDLDWFVDALGNAAIPAHLPRSRTRAVDGTDWETCGTFVTSSREYDGTVPEDTDADVDEHQKRIAKVRRDLARKRRARLGPDGRPIYTRDVDGRAGHRSANNRHNAGLYIGYELHLGVQVRDFMYGGKPDQLTHGPDVPTFITMARLVPAGSHRLDAVVPALVAERVPTQEAGDLPLRAVLWDRGYSILNYQRGKGALRAAGIEVVFDLSTRQRTLKAIYPGIDFIDGVPFSKHMPREMRDLPRPDSSDTPEERAAKTAAFDKRALWRFTPHGSSRDGVSRRWLCPFCAGRLRIVGGAARRANVNINASAPQVELPESESCCDGIVTLPDDAVELEQAFGLLWSTTAHDKAYGPRSLVEGVNNLAHDKYLRLDRGYTKLMGLAKRKFVLAFIVAGVNRKIAESWEAKEAERANWERRTEEHAAQLRGEQPTPQPSAAALRQRRSRAAKRARLAMTAAPAARRSTSARVVASRQ